MQLNKDIPSKEKSNTDLSSTQSIPIHSPNPSPAEGKAAQPPERKRKDANEAYRVYEEIIKDNISYDILKADLPYDGDRLDEIVDLILETVCTRRKTIRVAGDDYPAELVKSKFMKLDSEHCWRCCSMPRPRLGITIRRWWHTIWRPGKSERRTAL